jgi:TPR repeat protein
MLVTWVEIALGGSRQLPTSSNRFSDLSSLPTRVAVVCTVALLATPIASTVGYKKPLRLFPQRLFGRRGAKDTMANSRSLLPITLLTAVWFCSSTLAAQPSLDPAGDEEKLQADIPSLRQLAHQGDGKAAYLLGRAYMMGTGVGRDYQESAKWFKQAATEGSAEADFALGFLYEQGKGVARDYPQAVFYYSAAAKLGYPAAENNLASMYEHGQGVPKDFREAERWYRAAAIQGEIIAQCNLASLYFTGRGVTKDYAQAEAWFRAAAERGYAPAQENLGWMYYTGTGTTLDYSEAAKWVRRAAEQGYGRAQLDLGYLYEQGKGVPLDYVSAYACYKVAMAGGEKLAHARLKSLSRLLTLEQISAANVRAVQLGGSSGQRISAEDSNSIGSAFVKQRSRP